MEKNTFLMINDIIYDLYSCTSLNEIKAKFLHRLKMVIPYSYASILLHENTEDPDTIRLTSPICIPEAFIEAENEYMKVADEDHLLWLLHSREPRLVRSSNGIQVHYQKKNLHLPDWKESHQILHIKIQTDSTDCFPARSFVKLS